MTVPAGIIKTTYPDGSIGYHNGTLFDGAMPRIIGPYSDNGVTVPVHYWGSEWAYRPTPVSIKRLPAELVASRFMFPFGDTGCKVAAQPDRKPYTIMGSSDVAIWMQTTGERPDIGLVTDNSGYFMLGGSPLPMLDWADVNDTCPHHFRDETTGRPINLLTYPTAGCGDPGNGNPYLLKGEPDPKAPAYSQWGGGWGPQQAHFCEMAYLAYMATQDPHYLENLQYNANFTILCDPWMSRHRNIATIYGEYRGIAWAFRNLFMAHTATQDAEARSALPASCHPSSYWKTLLDNQLVYYSSFMADPKNQVFRLVSGPGQFGPWQVDYMLMALAFGVLTGHSDWTPLYLWAIKNAIDRTSNKSGYPPGYGGAYYMPDAPDWKTSWLTGIPTLAGAEPPTAAQQAILAADPLNDGKAMIGQEYLMTTRAVLIAADYLDKLGLAQVRKTYPELDSCIQICTTMNKAYGAMNPRVSIISTGGIIMPSAVTISLGQKVHLDVAFTGPKPPNPPVYTQSDATVGGLSAGDMAGVLFTSTKVGSTIVTATADGVNGPISATCGVTVTSPLPTGITLTPGVVS